MTKERSVNDRMPCPVCQADISLYCHRCPECGALNPKFHTLDRKLRETYVEFFVDPDVHRAVAQIAKARKVEPAAIYIQAVEEFIDRESRS
jgi:predicted amidophosphoribosyltransferase